MEDSVKEWAMSLKPQYIEAIKNGYKKYEVRTKVPGHLCPGERIFVVETASGGKVVLCFVVDGIYVYSPKGAWDRYYDVLGISKKEYNEYTRGRNRVFLIRFRTGSVKEIDMKVRDLGLKKAPQWFSRIV